MIYATDEQNVEEIKSPEPIERQREDDFDGQGEQDGRDDEAMDPQQIYEYHTIEKRREPIESAGSNQKIGSA